MSGHERCGRSTSTDASSTCSSASFPLVDSLGTSCSHVPSTTSTALGEGPPFDCLSKAQVEKCVDDVLRENTSVRQLIRAMQQAGCPVGRDYFTVISCDTKTGGGFSLQHGVILCHNRLETPSDVEHTLVHELVHAYDACRMPSLNFADCRQHACAEVRAANLSGECTFFQEFSRGHVAITQPTTWSGLHERCVRRRAALSAAFNPACGGPRGAREAVDEVYERCAADRAPFGCVTGMSQQECEGPQER
mmetsp:Transcript_12306/g.26558  ORF Transcript_12306/g.26558 Transcript_12306/m.26558 type:complete len:249 (+) Transcript_12306:125-871(+)|eukprot:CAMPEP_0202903618 /NCGR_PEP_ID=MMETSP1392-20130828/25419_1 /ASSEMBLY_ACC=CAM_ASM_000868 /TAXON_ID=225041 /ORGANISM="Chlamydomonas chlamydogama, Strain SAG 11-48b" /LENGTH=248 /DNA_ID=CAMNT_0049590883 /DNA_START=65 /DNA_END=811 /DNA_ORIENTATION=+